MSQHRKILVCASIFVFSATCTESHVFGQGALPVATAGDQVVIKREACRVVEPHRYRVPLSLEAVHTVTLVAPFDGTINKIPAKVNAKLSAQTEVIRLDNSDQKLRLNRAQAALKVVTFELRSSDKDEATKELSQAKIDLAKIDVEIAQSVMDKTVVRIPFAGEVQRILVTEAQFVRAGDPVAVVADTKMMKVEIPVDRTVAESGKTLGIKVESDDVEGKINAVLPLPAKFEPLRELFDSIASVEVLIDNPNDKYKVGQTVYADKIPRQPVAEVANSAVKNMPDGERKVQVVRQNIVRDIPVKLLGQVGTTRIFVSGAFADGDEAIYESSHQLGDGYQLKPVSTAASSGTAPAGTSTNTNPTKQPTGTGF